jgi:hypothetical protein
MSRLEAASVKAFHLLARELSAHGAPARLIAAARRSARDEVRHTRLTGALARRYGAAPLRARFSAPAGTRTLAAIARENATEGCVGETYGALVALWQGEHAADLHIARAMREIASDEVRHAELAWAVARWIEPKLSPASKRQVRRARAEALERVADSPSPLRSTADARLAGWPPPELDRGLALALAPELS